MKIELLKIINANTFAKIEQEDPYTHLTKFYELVGTLGASEVEEELSQIMTNWILLKEKFHNPFFPHNKFCYAKTAITGLCSKKFPTMVLMVLFKFIFSAMDFNCNKRFY